MHSRNLFKVPPALWCACIISLLFGYWTSARSELALIPEYQIGETAREDIATPVNLLVIDQQATDALRVREAQKFPAIFRYYAGASSEAEANLRGTFGITREEFKESLELAYNQRKLTAAQCTKPRFGQFVNSFNKKNKIFPLSTNLAEIWATGQPDEQFLGEWIAKLKQVMQQHIRTEPLPPEAKVGPVRLVTVQDTNVVLTQEMVEKQGIGFARSNIFSIMKVRKELATNGPPERQLEDKFLAKFVKVNCEFDATLTRLGRSKAGESLWSADTYQSGQMIVKSGQVVTAKIKAALDQLRANTALTQLGRRASENQESKRVTAESEELKQQAELAGKAALDLRQYNRWLLAGLCLGVLVSGVSIWRLIKWKRSRHYLPVRIGHPVSCVQTQGTKAVLSCPNCAETILLDFPLAKVAGAETREASMPEAIRETHGRAPFWVQRLLTKVVRGLVWQRALLLDTQRLAEMELTSLEKRLARMNAPLQERISAYEKRIIDLEKELTLQQQQNSDMIKAQIALARARLEAERQKVSLQ